MAPSPRSNAVTLAHQAAHMRTVALASEVRRSKG
jgi:hypothetical protein